MALLCPLPFANCVIPHITRHALPWSVDMAELIKDSSYFQNFLCIIIFLRLSFSCNSCLMTFSGKIEVGRKLSCFSWLSECRCLVSSLCTVTNSSQETALRRLGFLMFVAPGCSPSRQRGLESGVPEQFAFSHNCFGTPARERCCPWSAGLPSSVHACPENPLISG